MPVSATTSLLEPADLRLLQGLRLAPRRAFAGRIRGERLSRKKGISIEFADHRDYAAGDDLRHLDWSILARLGRPTIKTYQDEDDLAVYLALDASRSMDFGDPSKFHHAARLAAAVGFIALNAQDALYPVALGDGDPAPARALRGRAGLHPLAGWLAARRPDGARGLASSLSRLARAGDTRPGLFVCITDGLDPDAPDALRAVAARGHEVALVQVLSEVEVDPDLEGDLRLLDAETGATVEITAHAQTLRDYKQNLAAHTRRLEDAAIRTSGRVIQSIAGQSLPDFISALRRAGIAR